MPYGRLIDRARARIARERPFSGWQRLLGNLAARPRRLEAALRLARLGQRAGLRALARRTGLLGRSRLARLEAVLPALPAAQTWNTRYPADGRACGAVALFLGCFARLADTETIAAAIFLLNRFGYDVRVPDGQACCGALHQHAGDTGTARQLEQANLRAFAPGAEPVLYLASGCGARLVEYPEPFASRARDVGEFLASVAGARPLSAGRQLRVAVHEACTQRNVLRNAASVYALLGSVRGLEAVPLAGNGQCCGGAGSYFLDEPEIAGRLGAEKIAAIERAGVRTVLTSNFGCALHLNAGLRARGIDVEVIHPAVLLRRIVEAGA